MVADRQPDDDRGGEQQPIGPVRVGRRIDGRIHGAAAPGILPVDEQPQDDRKEREVERVRIGMGPDRPDDRRQHDRDAGDDTEQERPAHAPGEVDGERPTDPDEDRRQHVRPQRRLAEGLEKHGREPPDEDVRRVAGRMSGSHQREHHLELCGVPEPEARHQPPDAHREGEQSDTDRSDRRHVNATRAGATASEPANRLRVVTSRARRPTRRPRS